MKFEICIGSLDSALNAQKAGADRVELCSALSIGGITPSYGLIESVRNNINIDINVLIRLRQGDFLYSKNEIEVMVKDIAMCGKMGVNGVVIGALDKYGNIDVPTCKYLIEEAKKYSLSVTFHRAIDACKDIFGAVNTIIELGGVDRILSSGGKNTAFEGMETLAKMNKIAGDKVIIMPGSGVNANNIKELVDYTKVKEIHFSASEKIESEMIYREGISFTPNSLGGDFTLLESSYKKIVDTIISQKQKE
jgi:Uncharacterized protein involved in copper resistance